MYWDEDEGSREFEGYDVALVCENGHEVNSCSRTYPKHNAAHCKRCGGKSLNTCLDCGAQIRGHFYSPGVVDLTGYDVPSYCHNCGKPYPWTQSALNAAEELVRISEKLSETEKDELVNAVQNATRDTPQGKVAVEKIKRIGAKLGGETYKILLGVITDIASEYTKKTLGLGA